MLWVYFLCANFFCTKLYLINVPILAIKYKHITDKLLDSLVRRVYQGLLNHSKNSDLLEIISGKSESYLRAPNWLLGLHQEVLSGRIMCQKMPCVAQHQQSVEIRTLYQSTPLKLLKNVQINGILCVNNIQ